MVVESEHIYSVKEPAMSRIRILVVKVDDDNNDNMAELASFDMPEMDIDTLKPETALDDLEASTYEIGTAALRKVVEARWDEIDKQLADKYRQSFPPSHHKSRRKQKR
jgi:hypothetical protein